MIARTKRIIGHGSSVDFYLTLNNREIIMDDETKKLFKDLLSAMDEFSEIEFLPGTTEYDVKRWLVHSANMLRELLKEDSTCEHSGVKFNNEGKLVDFL